MAQKKVVTKTRRDPNGTVIKGSNGKGNGKTATPKTSRDGSEPTANELTLRAWKHLYAKRDRFGKF